MSHRMSPFFDNEKRKKSDFLLFFIDIIYCILVAFAKFIQALSKIWNTKVLFPMVLTR